VTRGKASDSAICRGLRWRTTGSTNYGRPNAPMTVRDSMPLERRDLLRPDLMEQDLMQHLELPNSAPPERESAWAREPQPSAQLAWVRQA
jgi:hypothetical protein